MTADTWLLTTVFLNIAINIWADINMYILMVLRKNSLLKSLIKICNKIGIEGQQLTSAT